MLVCIVLLIGLVTLFACNKGNVADKDGQTKVIVKIQDEDGSIYKENVVFSDLFTLSLQKEGYTGRLYRDADFLKPLTKDSKVKNGDTVYVKWTINKYTVTFMDGEKVLRAFTNVPHGSAVTAPEVSEKYGKTFIGWDKPFDNVTSDLTVNAKWETKKFTLTFINFDGTTVYTAEVEYGASISDHFETADSAATYDDTILDYVGWYDQSDTEKTIIDDFSELTMPTRDLTYVLKLRLMDSAIGEFKVNTPADFTFTESSTAEFSVMPNEGTTLHAGVTYKYIWTINKDNVFYKTEETTESSLTLQNLAAGEYFAKVRIVASMKNCGSVEKEFAGETLTVSRAEISGITVVKGVTMTYGDKNAKIEIDNLLATDVVTYGTDGTTFPLQNVDLSALDYGEHDYFVRVDRGDNYNPYTSGKITVTINKATVTATVTPDDDTLTYGDNLPSLTAAINGETYKIESGEYELHLGMTSITGNVANNVGTYNIENVNISVLRTKYSEKNYNITVETVGAITIDKAKLTVTVSLDKTELTYGEASPIISYKFDGLKLSDAESDFTITKTELAEKLDAGTYTASVTLSGDKTNFYNITVNTVEFKVNKRPATITIDKVNDITYGDEEPKLSAKVKNVLDGDTLSYTLKTDYSAKKKPGGYNAFVEIKEGDNSNYNVSVVNKTFTVLKKELTITLGSKRVAAGKEYKVDAASLTIDGLLADDTVTGYVTITKTEAGVYTANDFDKTNLKFDSKCYKVIKYDLTVEFVKVDFKIHFEDHEVVYDGQNHSVAVTADDGTNYTITYGTKKGIYDLTDAPSYKNAGVYVTYFKVVDNSLDDGSEYEDEIKLTVKKAEVEIKIGTYTMTYGNELPEFSYEATGLLNGDTLSGEAQYIVEGMTDGNVGTYKVKVGGLSANDNYAITVVPGTLTINQKSIAVVWSTKDKYVYSPDGQEMPAATYDGRSAKVTTNGEFKNAGTYTFTATDESGNYTLTNAVLNVVIKKATYSGIVHAALSGVYNPAKTLKDYALAEGFTWVDASEKPVCTKTEYKAIYNMDPANYEDFATTVTLVLQKATVTLAQNLFEFNFVDGEQHEIGTTVRYNNIEVTEPYTLTFEKNTFSDAGTHKTTATLTADNFALSDNVVYVKVKGVKVGNNYYTIEDALDVATSGQTIFVLNDTAFATTDIAGALYNDAKFKTVKTGVTLLLPFNENDTVGHIGAGEDGSANYKATAALTGTAKLYKTLVIPEGIEVIVNGKLVVGAQTGKIDAGQNQNAVSGNYCEITLGGTITLNNATLEVYGYIKGNGEITANNTTVIENLYLSGWMGGKLSAIRYIGNDKIFAGSLVVEGTLKIDNPTQFPFSQYELRSIQSGITINKGSKLQGYCKIATGKVTEAGQNIPAQINEAILTFISSDASNAANGLFRLVGNNSKIIKSMSGDRVKFDLFGEIKDGYTSISVKVIKKTVSMTSEKVFFPIDGRTDITLKNGATFTQGYMFKALPGATITVENGGTYNLNGKLIMYDKSFTDISTYSYPGASRGDAKLIVNGTMNVNGALGGNVTSDNAGTVSVGANATISGVHSAEGEGTMARGSGAEFLTIIFTYNDTCGVTKSLVFVNADNSTVAAETNKTYNYNNGTWQ